MVDTKSVLDYANTFDWSPYDNNNFPALWSIIKNHVLTIDSGCIPAKSIDVYLRPVGLSQAYEEHFSVN